MRHVDPIMEKFRRHLAIFARNYYTLYGYSPTEKHLDNMVRQSLDLIEDPKVRAKIRAGVARVKITMDPAECAIHVAMRADTLKTVNRYLAKKDPF